MWKPWRKKEVKPELVLMTPEDKAVIYLFAVYEGYENLRVAAIDIYRKYLPHREAYGSHPEMNFMSEVDTPCPDLLLRATYRKALLDKNKESMGLDP